MGQPPLAFTAVDSPVGRLLAVASEAGLCALPFVADDEAAALERVAARCRKWFGSRPLSPEPSHPVLRDTRNWLTAYFAGALGDCCLPPLDLRGPAFQQSVWRSLLDIPMAGTCSYGALARRIGNPGASRAVGLANGANPVPIIVPCHRVIGASGALTGYGGGLPRKTWLLEHERRHWGTTRVLPFG